jgi:hypothetical protein
MKFSHAVVEKKFGLPLVPSLFPFLVPSFDEISNFFDLSFLGCFGLINMFYDP